MRVIFNAGQSAIDAEVIEVSPHGMHLYVESASCLPAICMIGISSSDRLFSAHIIARTDTDLFVEFD
ncbi:MAG: hypothetical protein LJE67_10060 [Salaquimonas sp.]|nr:hypothetical protein [Salaquimonas sp.]